MSRDGDEAGTMLVELLVGMVLMSIVGMLVLGGIINGFKGQRHLQNQSEALEVARRAAQRVTREIREASPVLSATASTLAVRHSTDTGTVTQEWSLDSSTGTTRLRQTTTVYVGTVAQPAVTTTVIDDLDTTTTLPFSYSPVPGWTAPTGVAVDAGTCAITGSMPVTYAPKCIGKVSIHLVRNVPNHASVSVDATVDVRNRS